MALTEYVGLSPLEAGLAKLMSDVSEECYAAGWMSGCEYDVWRLITEGGTWGRSGAEWLPQLPILKATAEAINGWIAWDDTAGRDDCYYRVVPMDEWLPMYAAEKAKRDAAHAERLAKQEACDHTAGRVLWRCAECGKDMTKADAAAGGVS